MGNPLKTAALLAKKHEPSTTETVEMTEIAGIKQEVILRFTDAGKSDDAKQLNTCYGDLYIIINALRDYANMLENVVQDWGLTGFQAATYQLHAERCRKIAGEYSAAIGYDYDKALALCQKHKAKRPQSCDTGMDSMEALIYKNDINFNEETKGEK